MDTTLPRVAGQGAVLRSRPLLSRMSDERLVDQIRRGNEVAFEVAYDRHYRGILSFARHMLTSREEAEDAVQHTFLAAYSSLLASDRPIQLGPWLYTIARNRSLSVLRGRRETASEDIEISTDGFSAEVQNRADLRQLVADVRELPEQQRAALVLSEVGDLSHSDVAQVLGCEPAKVKSLVFQARSGLIERRSARETPCDEIREQISTLRGGALRRGPLRRHLKGCPSCSEFRDEVKRQRAMLGLVLPVIPTLGLKESALAAIGIGGGGGGAALGGGAGAALVAKVGTAKLAAVAVVAGAASIGGGVAAVSDRTPLGGDAPPAAKAADRSAASGTPGGANGAGAPVPADGSADEDSARKRQREIEQRERRAEKRERTADRKQRAGAGEGSRGRRGDRAERREKAERARGRENALERGRGRKYGLRRKLRGDRPSPESRPAPQAGLDDGDDKKSDEDEDAADAIDDLSPTERTEGRVKKPDGL